MKINNKQDYLRFLNNVKKYIELDLSKHLCTAGTMILMNQVESYIDYDLLHRKAPMFLKWINRKGRELNKYYVHSEPWFTTKFNETFIKNDFLKGAKSIEEYTGDDKSLIFQILIRHNIDIFIKVNKEEKLKELEKYIKRIETISDYEFEKIKAYE